MTLSSPLQRLVVLVIAAGALLATCYPQVPHAGQADSQHAHLAGSMSMASVTAD